MLQARRIAWRRSQDDQDALLAREWLITNGLGGYASGTIGGAPTRRYHGLLVAALPNPLGRTMMLNHLTEMLSLPGGADYQFGGYERSQRLELRGVEHLRQFELDAGLPVWTFDFGPYVLERRLFFTHLQNTLFIHYTLQEGPGPVRLSLRPTFHFRSHDAPVSTPTDGPYPLHVQGEQYEVHAAPLPSLRLRMCGDNQRFVCQAGKEADVTYRVEAARGYEAAGEQWYLGRFQVELTRGRPATLVASTESWGDLMSLEAEEAALLEGERRRRLVALARVNEDDAVGRELVLAADQFVVSPRGRLAAAARAHASGEELRTVIAGYHWFTDWGRDTMISLEGLTLQTGRFEEARWILNMFARSVRDGLLPNLFPEGSHEGLYHTADATLWFFHAIDRYVRYTGDRETLRELLPTLESIVDSHRRGTHFGIGVDDRDALLRQGQEGYQLTWMDAKCDDWVVTPRRGKAVEINALWYNALCNLAQWLTHERTPSAGAELADLAERVAESFNARFWIEGKGYLYDVVDLQGGGADDDALRPNQLFAVSLPNAVLKPERWAPVLEAVQRELWTPAGLRSLAPQHPDYKPNYHGDLRTRDAAYHQGTVWAWLIGPYVDAWLKVHPTQRATAREQLSGLVAHLGDACVGSVSEVFDAEPPYAPRGCIAQAWSIAELLRVWRQTERSEP